MFGTLYKKLVLVAAVTLAVSFAAHAADDALDRIKQTGKFVVGIKVDYRPFGYRNEKGEMLGLEHDLVADIASRLSTKLGKKIEVEKVVVTAQNRMQFLQQGRIDFMIATMNDTPERRKIIDIIDPNYYASGVNLLTRKSNNLKNWEDLKGKTVCTMQGAWYNKSLSEQYGFVAQAYAGVAEAAQATFDNRCVGFLDDDAHGGSLLLGSDWSGFEMPLQTQSEAPWGMAVALGNPALKEFLTQVATDWHRKGTLVELEKKWGIKPTKWVQTMHAKAKAAN
jgi:polar amino acid transport system substrate-binding protein